MHTTYTDIMVCYMCISYMIYGICYKIYATCVVYMLDIMQDIHTIYHVPLRYALLYMVCSRRQTMRRYKYLNNRNAPKRDVAYNSKDIANKYVFQRSSLEISYMVCDTVDEFFVHYSRKTPCSRMYFEVINDEFRPQKFKLDIDGRINTNEMEYVLKVVQRIIRKLTKVCKPDILVYDIATSHHVVITNLCFSATSCEMLANAIKHKLYKKYPDVSSLIDTVVYKKVQMFRVEGSTKYKQRRWKYLCGSKELSSLDVFKKGIISFIEECYHVQEDKVVDIMQDMGIYQPVEYFRKETKNIQTIPKEFVVRKVIGKLVVLDRVMPSYCHMCRRVHDNENAYMVGQRFFCRRF